MKSNANNQLLRMQTLIEQDRLEVSDGFSQLLLSDLNKLLLDYFDFNGAPEITMQKISNEYQVNIILRPSRVKAFYNIPKD